MHNKKDVNQGFAFYPTFSSFQILENAKCVFKKKGFFWFKWKTSINKEYYTTFCIPTLPTK